jgi:hypothetical protein
MSHGKFQATQRELKTVLEKVAGAKNFRGGRRAKRKLRKRKRVATI